MEKKAIILSGIAWNTTLQRHHKMAMWLKELGYEVDFVEAIPSSKLTIKKVILKVRSHFIKKSRIYNKVEVNVIKGRFFPSNKIFNYFNRIEANKILKKLSLKYDVVINYLPIYTTDYIINKINYKKLFYDCVRDFENWGGYPLSIKKYEKKLHEISDAVLTDSYYLTNKHNGIQILPSLSEQEYQVFKKNEKPLKIKKIVYFGQVDTHIDLKILKKISQEYELHVIGNSNLNLDFDYINHGFFSNKEKLAEEIIKCDAIIIPYFGNMNGVIPAKLMEALASRLPVFISSFYDSEYLSMYCYVYHSYEQLNAMIKNYDPNDKIIPKEFIEQNIEKNQLSHFKKIIECNKKKV